jgi:hypothetical protein
MTSTNLSAGDYLGMAAAQLDDVASTSDTGRGA